MLEIFYWIVRSVYIYYWMIQVTDAEYFSGFDFTRGPFFCSFLSVNGYVLHTRGPPWFDEF